MAQQVRRVTKAIPALRVRRVSRDRREIQVHAVIQDLVVLPVREDRKDHPDQ